jgi:hypothetical protein
MSFGSGDETSSGSVNIGIYEETSTKGIPMLPDHIMDNFSISINSKSNLISFGYSHIYVLIFIVFYFHPYFTQVGIYE